MKLAFLRIVAIFFFAICSKEVCCLGLKSDYKYSEHLERKLAFDLTQNVTRTGHLLCFPAASVPIDKKLVIGVLKYPREFLYIIEDDNDLKNLFDPTSRIQYYFIDRKFLK